MARCVCSSMRRQLSSVTSLVVREGYGGVSLLRGLPLPQARSQSDVLVEVRAAALNPIDVALADGYGAGVLEKLRGAPPFVLGQEFSGVVRECGTNVLDLRVGDEVYGAVDPWSRCGTMTTHLRVHESDVGRKPASLSFEQAACLPFAAMTVWRPVVVEARRLGAKTAVVFGRGTIGRMASALLVCEAGVTDVLCVGREGLPHGADGEARKFDVVVDATSNRGQPLSEAQRLVAPQGLFVTFNGVWLTRVTERGALSGSFDALTELLEHKVQSRTRDGSSYSWGVMRAAGGGTLTRLAQRIDSGQLTSVAALCHSDTIDVLRDGLPQLADEWNTRALSGGGGGGNVKRVVVAIQQ